MINGIKEEEPLGSVHIAASAHFQREKEIKDEVLSPIIPISIYTYIQYEGRSIKSLYERQWTQESLVVAQHESIIRACCEDLLSTQQLFATLQSK